MSKEEIEKMVNQAEEMKAADESRRRSIEIRNDADSLIYSTEKNLQEYGEKIAETLRDDIRNTIGELRGAMDQDNEEAMKAGVDKLKNLSLEIGKSIYQQQQQQ